MSPRHITADPDVMVRAKAGLLWGALVAVVSGTAVCTAYVVRMDAKIDSALESVQRIEGRIETIAPQHAILWDWYGRTASRPAMPRANL